MIIKEDVETLRRTLAYEEDSKIWKGVKHQWQIQKELRERFGKPKRNQTKILRSIDNFEHQSNRLNHYYLNFFVYGWLYFIALLGSVVPLL